MRSLQAALAAVTLGSFLAAASSAAELTGSPVADGWTAAGASSLDNGTYIRGSGNFAFDLYSTAYPLDPTSSLIASTAADTGFEWLAGDQIIGMGGVVVPGEPAANYGWPNVSGDPINSNLTNSVRIVSKFGTSPTSWSASTTAPVPGNGNGSSSAGFGGVGALLIGTTGGIQQVVAANEGIYFIPTTATQYRASETNVNGKAGRIMFDLDNGTTLLKTWETILNVSLLQRNAGAYGFVGADYPQVGDRNNMVLQRSNSTTLFTDALIVSVPEPAALTTLAVGGLAIVTRRRRNTR